jgi:hypothetical protein
MTDQLLLVSDIPEGEQKLGGQNHGNEQQAKCKWDL